MEMDNMAYHSIKHLSKNWLHLEPQRVEFEIPTSNTKIVDMCNLNNLVA